MGVVRYPTENLVIGDYWNLWERSVPLKLAFHSFGPSEDVAEYRRLKAAQPPIHLGHVIGTLYTAIGQETEFSAGAQAYKDYTASPSGARLKELEQTLKDRTAHLLRTHQLFGIGFNAPRKADDAPCFVSLDCWQEFIGWDSGKVRSGSLKMENVRIGTFRWLEECNTSESETVIKTPEDDEPKNITYGRPTKRDLMWQAYMECVEAGKIDFSQPKFEAHRTVIAHIRKFHPDQYDNGKGLNKKTFLPIIREHYDAKILKLKRI